MDSLQLCFSFSYNVMIYEISPSNYCKLFSSILIFNVYIALSISGVSFKLYDFIPK